MLVLILMKILPFCVEGNRKSSFTLKIYSRGIQQKHSTKKHTF